jgi:hypothetical protein
MVDAENLLEEIEAIAAVVAGAGAGMRHEAVDAGVDKHR